MNLSNSELQFFPDLSNQIHEEVNVNENYLRVISEDMLPRGVKRLKVDYNYLKSDGLPVVFPDTIEELSFNHNTITDFRDVDHFPTHLKKLSVNHNPLHTLANLNTELLEELTIEKTHIDTIALLPRSLLRLEASYNYLTMLPNRFPMNIRVVNLSHNSLRYAGLPGFWGTALEELHLSDNKIERFPRNLPPSLRVLNLTNNRLSEIPTSLQQLPNLKVLALANNKLRTITLEIRRHPIHLVNVAENELTVSLQGQNRDIQSRWATVILEGKNWTTHHHQKAAQCIQKNWRTTRIQVRIRTWKRIGVLREELLCVSMMPERVWQTDVISPEWKRS